MRNIKILLNNLPQQAGVYQMLDAKGTVLYVGKARDLKKRLTSYFSSRAKDLKTQTLIKHIHDFDITVTNTESEAVLLECNLIKKHHPRYNVLLRDDKSYPYILITTSHPYPRIDLYRGSRQKNARYFGPYSSAYAVRDTISLLQKIFRIRTCTDSYFAARTRPCLLYQLERCTGPCVNLISKEEYARNVELAILFLEGRNDEAITELQKRMEGAAQDLDYESAAHYRDQIARLRHIQEKQYVSLDEGNADSIGLAIQAGVICIQMLSIRKGQTLGSRSYFPSVPLHSTKEEIITAFLTQYYLSKAHVEEIPKQILTDVKISDENLLAKVLTEQAKHKVEILNPKRGEKKNWIKMATNSAAQSLSVHLLAKTNVHKRLVALQNILTLEKIPQRIECFDISHSMGEATVASCVVFNHLGPHKNDYRRFNITGIIPGDDVAAMHQVLSRRFKRLQKESGTLPDVVLIDGGITQLSAAKKVLEELNIKDVTLVAVAKGPERKPGYETLHINENTPIHLPADSLALHFIQQVRDEAHRFAITGHRQRRDKTRRQSSLELIPGIGAKRRRELLRYFGGIQGLAHASLEEIAKVPGISHSLAKRIYANFHE